MDIDKLFSEYNSKKQSEQAKIKATYEREKAYTKAGLKILEETVNPIFKDFDMKLVLKGGNSKVEESLDCAKHPRVELHFSPEEGILNQSTLWVRQEKEDFFEIKSTIIADRGRSKKENKETIKHKDLDKNKVKEIVNDFVTKVFQEYL